MDEVIFEGFKGTGNMELQLDRSLSNKRIFPAVNLVASSTRRDDLLLSKETLDRMWILRNIISEMNSMEAMDYIKKNMDEKDGNRKDNRKREEPSVPEGLWLKCPKCGEMVYKDDVKNHHYVCPKCEGYFRIKTKTRIRMVADKGTFREWFEEVEGTNPLDYPEYAELHRS